jgi:hypothetical protein
MPSAIPFSWCNVLSLIHSVPELVEGRSADGHHLEVSGKKALRITGSVLWRYE